MIEKLKEKRVREEEWEGIRESEKSGTADNNERLGRKRKSSIWKCEKKQKRRSGIST